VGDDAGVKAYIGPLTFVFDLEGKTVIPGLHDAHVPSKGWAEIIKKVYEVDPLICPSCGGQMKIIAFIEDHKVIDRIIRHLKLIFVAERPPPPQVAQHELLMAAEDRGEYF
jgi:hypothetical protein